MSNTRHINAIPTETDEEIIEVVDSPRASITITEPKFVNKTRNFVKRHAPKVGFMIVGAVAGITLMALSGSDDDDETKALEMNSDGDVIEAKVVDHPIYFPTSEEKTETIVES